MIITKLDIANDYLIEELDESSPKNVFLVGTRKILECFIDNSPYVIILYSSWYGEHMGIIDNLFKNSIKKFPEIAFGFKIFNQEKDLPNELGVLYKGGIGKMIFVFVKNRKIVEYTEDNLSSEHVNKILETLR